MASVSSVVMSVEAGTGRLLSVPWGPRHGGITTSSADPVSI